MEPPYNDTMSELFESFRNLADSGALWSRLVGKFRRPIQSPPAPDERSEDKKD